MAGDQEDPVEKWAKSVAPRSRINYVPVLNRFLKWMGVDARTLIERQRRADADHEYEILDKLQQYVREYRSVDKTGKAMPVTRNTKEGIYNIVRSFFARNRAPLPSDKQFGRSLRGEKPPSTARLTVEDVHRLCLGATLREKSMLLTQFQTLSGTGELEYINLNCGDQIVAQMREGKQPIRIDMPMGRKMNPEPYHTFIGKDAADALREYFEKERGWPGKGEPIWLTKPLGEFQQKQLKDVELLAESRVPVFRDAYRDNIRQLSRRIGMIPKQVAHTRGVRYGYNPNEIRDVARSVSRKATPSGFDIICAEFWMGHTIDPLGYDKLQKLEPGWSEQQYRLVEPYLNIISNPPGATVSSDQARKNAILDFAKVQGLPEEKLIQLRKAISIGAPMEDVVKLGRELMQPGGAWINRPAPSSTRERPRRTKRKVKAAVKGRTAHNGGMRVDSSGDHDPPFQTQITSDEEELTRLVSEGWNIVAQLHDGKVVLRRPNGKAANVKDS